MGNSYNWYNSEARPLPGDVGALPKIEAELWLKVHPETDLPLNLEGPIFDTAGNFYFCCNGYGPEIGEKLVKVSADGQVSDFFKRPGIRITGLAIHKDGRIFGADIRGSIVILSPDGEIDKLIPMRGRDGEMMAPDDLVFDDRGNLFFTDLRGWPGDPKGGVFRLDAESGYEGTVTILENMCAPNGISFSPDYKALWIGESGRKTLTRIEFLPDGRPDPHGGINIINMSVGEGFPDSNKVDSDGNIYQAVVKEGRVAIFNRHGVQIANVLIPGRDEGIYLMSSNLVIKPGTDEGYCVAGGEPAGKTGAAIFRFKALSKAQLLYSHM